MANKPHTFLLFLHCNQHLPPKSNDLSQRAEGVGFFCKNWLYIFTSFDCESLSSQALFFARLTRNFKRRHLKKALISVRIVLEGIDKNLKKDAGF